MKAPFFLIALPGLEDLVLRELQAWYPHIDAKAEHGGVSFEAEMTEALSMNLVLKTPTRILLRVDTFRCRDFPKLFNKIKKFSWSQYVDTDCSIDVHVSTKKSRLSIKSRIERTCLDAWGKNKDPKKRLGFFIRLNNDDCTLSLDTSGERLHKRGVRKHIGEAPLRENIAAALISMLATHAADDSRPIEVIDPMMGSGSFLIEASSLHNPVNSRDFAFEHFKSSDVAAPKYSGVQLKPVKLIGYEKEPGTFKAACENLNSSDLINEDFFSSSPLPSTDNQRWLLCNPPYGERLKVSGPLKDFYEKLFTQCEAVAKPDYACFLLPSKALSGKMQLPPGWKVLEKRAFLNGGLSVTAFVFGRKS